MMRCALTLATLLTGCGGGSPEEAVEACGSQILPRVHACIPAEYRGADAEPLRPCVSPLAADLRACRAEGAGEFAAYMDHRVGHAARVLIESLTD